MSYKIKTPAVRKTAKIGSLIDYYYDLREEKRQLKAGISIIDAKMKEIENASIDKLKKNKIKGSKASHSQGTIASKTSYSIDDWAEFYTFAKRKDNLDLLGHSCNASAVKLREEEGKKIPGTKKNTHVYLSVTKL